MKILLISTSGHTGGAAIAALRLMTSLQNNGIQAKMLVANKEYDNPSIVSLNQPLRHKARFLFERFIIYARQRFSRTHLFDIDPAMTGADITRLPEFKEADIIHLHWVNQGFLSLNGVRRIMQSGKPVVWTMHDMWAFTGICHHAHECEGYKKECGHCPLLLQNGKNDLSHSVWQRKKTLWNQYQKLTFVACSKWLANLAGESSLLRNHRVVDIVNAIDTTLYSPRPRADVRQQLGLPQDKTLILFCAYNVTLPIKGLDYLRQACNILIKENPALTNKLGLLLVGKGAESIVGNFPIEVFSQGLVTDEHRMALLYNAANLFCIPSIQDNLPNTIVEAKASELPVVGTRVGGIPQMINHGADGYLAEPRNATSLAHGIKWVLFEADTRQIGIQSRLNAVTLYSETTVAQKHIKLYEQLYHNED